MSTITTLSIGGDRISGDDVRSQNVKAAQSIANIVKSSLGPVGLDKMLVDDVGDVTITNDGATILKLLDVEHPAAKILCELADLQDQEVGDGTTSVVLVAAELLKNAQHLISQQIHPTTIINGYKKACKMACSYIQNDLSVNVDQLDSEALLNAGKTSMSSKLIGPESDFFARMALNALKAVRNPIKGEVKDKETKSEKDKTTEKQKVVIDGSGEGSIDIPDVDMNEPVEDKEVQKNISGYSYPIKAINILKAHGKSSQESVLVEGYALNCTRSSEAMPRSIEKAKIACLDMDLQKIRMKLGIQIVIDDPEKLEAIKKRESDIVKERLEKVLKAGANVVLVTGGIDDLCLKYLVEAKAMGVRRCKKVDLKRIAKATGATLLATLSTEDGVEEFNPSYLGEAEMVIQERICADELILIQKPKANTAASIILRGANDYMLDEMERSLHDALCVLKRVLESKHVVPGGGCVEAACSVYLENFATSMNSREQLAVADFAQALLVIPKTLTVNAAKDAVQLVANLCAYHNMAKRDNQSKQYQNFGIDLEIGKATDFRKKGIFEPTLSKVKSFKFATEAAITILRIDDLIKLHPEKKDDPRDVCQ
ncbi:hypothetical protein SNEBB_009814 [Seison nebaliae]|nr:hypothetical protein SNEBB_009814 [Seison nebaliae]